jgi:hypothetical protein
LGIFCQHTNAHAHSALALPGNLKGADMAVYNVFRTLGLDIQVRAILDTESDAFEDYYQDCAEDTDYDEMTEYEDSVSPAFSAHAVVGRLGGRTASEVGGSEEGIEEVVQA